jgi:hypothetical protein
MVIDFLGLSAEEARDRFPDAYQRILTRVKPERDHNNRASRREKWWLFGEPISTFRPALAGLKRFISTVETSKYRFFVFLDGSILPDNMLLNIAVDDAYHLGVLSARIHVVWALAAGGRLRIGNDPRYNKTRCFDPFPFPVCSDEQKQRIHDLGEQLDRHRKERQVLHPNLTMTGVYNVLEKLRTGLALTEKEKDIHERGLVSVLKQIHDDLDATVFAAYGWPLTLSDEEILERLVALNKERVEEERRGLVRWLRPEFQAPRAVAAKPTQEELEIAPVEAKVAAPKKQPWPKALPEQVQAVRAALAARAHPAPADIARTFKGARNDRIEEVLATLAALGQARVSEGRFAAVV